MRSLPPVGVACGAIGALLGRPVLRLHSTLLMVVPCVGICLDMACRARVCSPCVVSCTLRPEEPAQSLMRLTHLPPLPAPGRAPPGPGMVPGAPRPAMGPTGRWGGPRALLRLPGGPAGPTPLPVDGPREWPGPSPGPVGGPVDGPREWPGVPPGGDRDPGPPEPIPPPGGERARPPGGICAPPAPGGERAPPPPTVPAGGR